MHLKIMLTIITIINFEKKKKKKTKLHLEYFRPFTTFEKT